MGDSAAGRGRPAVPAARQVSVSGTREVAFWPCIIWAAYVGLALLEYLRTGTSLLTWAWLATFAAVSGGALAVAQVLNGGATLFLDARGIRVDADLVPWARIERIRLTGGGQDGIRLRVEFRRGAHRRVAAQRIPDRQDPLELARLIERAGGCTVDIDPYVAQGR